MSYTALYRKFRPASFDDVKGQDHIVTTLRNQIASGRIGHAYLFCGTRGTGKTTVAKIFARAVNCETPVNGSPCGECSVCRAIAGGAALNVSELDAASNNGVDAVRELIDEIAYSPPIGRYKVYIIDEAHMITPAGANALLKTLEEPPEYVIFILATTDPQRLLTTILSRCQRYDFHRITIDTIYDRLKYICETDSLDVEEKALRYIAKMGDGSMRDALSLLDQCVAFHYGHTLTYDNALDVLGAVDTGVFDAMLRAVMNRNVVECIDLLGHIVDQGRDISQFVTDLIWYIRCVMLVQTDAALEDAIDINTEDKGRLRETAASADREDIRRYIFTLSGLVEQFRYSAQKRILLEMTLIRMCDPGGIAETRVSAPAQSVSAASDDADPDSPPWDVADASPQAAVPVLPPDVITAREFSAFSGDIHSIVDALESRLRNMEARLKDGSIVTTAQDPTPPRKLPDALPEEIAEVNNRWNELLERMQDIGITSYLAECRRSISEDGQLVLVWDGSDSTASISYYRLQSAVNSSIIEQKIEEMIGKHVNIQLKRSANKAVMDHDDPDISELANGIVIEEEDEPDPDFVGFTEEN